MRKLILNILLFVIFLLSLGLLVLIPLYILSFPDVSMTQQEQMDNCDICKERGYMCEYVENGTSQIIKINCLPSKDTQGV